MNETPESPQPTSPDASGSASAAAPSGDHGFAAVTSSDAAAPALPAPGVTPDPDVPPVPPVPPAYDPNGSVPPYGGYPAPAPAPRKPMSKGLLFGIIGGAAALVLIVAAAIIVPAVLRGPAITASDVVEDYLTALSEGDAEGALQHVEAYGDETLLTDEVLARSLELGAIDDIEVGEVADGDSYESVVPVTFTIGGQPVSRDFQVYDYGDDEWQISDGVIALSGFSGFEGLGLTVNGADASAAAYVFPGTYELALGVEQFVIGGGTSTFVVTNGADAEQLWDLRPALTDGGTAQYRALVRASVEECVAMKTLATPCGMDLTDIDLTGYTPIEGSVTRTITAEGQSALDNLTPEVSSGAVVTSYDSVGVDMTLQGELGGTVAEFELLFGGYLNSPKVDFAADAPVVVWE